MDMSFTLDEIEERDVEVAARPGRDDISVCTCAGFCLREAGRNAIHVVVLSSSVLRVAIEYKEP